MSVFHCPEITSETLKGEQHMPATAELSMIMSMTNSSSQLQSEPCFFAGLDNKMNGLFLYMFTPQPREMCTPVLGIYRAHKEQTKGRFPGS